MRVLITGGAGFIGSRLVPMLLDLGHQVRVVDIGMFGLKHVASDAEVIQGDILDFDPAWTDGIDSVIHLAGLSNDPMAAFSPELNYKINGAGAAIVAQAAADAGVSKFVFSSTCSVYGFSDERERTEEEPVSTSFPYAISKVMGEQAVRCLVSGTFRPIILRNATVIGWSPRMRFDLVVNAMLRSALKTGRIEVHNGSLWRPILDVQDAARALVHALLVDESIIGCFNVAHSNHQVGALAETVVSTLAEFGLSVGILDVGRADVRSYRVRTSLAEEVLNFRAEVEIRESIREIMTHIRLGDLPNLDEIRFFNVEQMKVNLQFGELRLREGEELVKTGMVVREGQLLVGARVHE